ncbi:MAG: hypothetical protein F4Z79_04530 [Acidimicrobiia bacterium]|nr:hypothetical protein [Acidimicrobiia bacterium]
MSRHPGLLRRPVAASAPNRAAGCSPPKLGDRVESSRPGRAVRGALGGAVFARMVDSGAT